MQLEDEENSSYITRIFSSISEGYICQLCKDNCLTKSYLENELANHSNSHLIKCLSCNKTFHDTCGWNLK